MFYRTNAQSRVFEEVFIRVGMPYKVVGGVRFYERREVRDALAYLRMLVNPADEISLRRILNTPKRGIGDRAEACVAGARRARADHVLGGAAPRRRGARARDPVADARSRASSAMVEELQSMVDAGERADVVLESVLERTGYLAELEASDDPQDETRVENLAELVAVAREFSDDPVAGPSADPADVDAGTVAPGLGDFLERVALVADSDQIPDAPDGEDAGVVTLMTLHTAKGLEFPVVFLTGLEDGVFPHSRSLGDQPELEEERRLAYVGVTRAQRAALRLPGRGPLRLGRARRTTRPPGSSTSCRSTSSTGGAPRPPRPRGAARTGQRSPPPRLGLGAPTAAGRRNFSSAAAARRRRGQGQAGPRDPLASSPATGSCTTRSAWARSSPSRASADKAVASIDFGSEGVKRLLLRYAPVEKL